MELSDILKFNVHRRFINIGKNILVTLEKTHTRIKELEAILIKMGINADQYESSPYDYKKDRAQILSEINDASRECQSLMDGFKIELKK